MKTYGVNTGKVKLFLIIFAVILGCTVPSIVTHMIEIPISNSIKMGAMVHGVLQVLLVCYIMYCAYGVIKLIDAEAVFDLKMVHLLKCTKFSLLALAIISIINFGMRSSIALINMDFSPYLRITIDFNTLFLIGVALFTEVMLNVIAKGIEIKVEQELTI